jgi:MFS family permease
MTILQNKISTPSSSPFFISKVAFFKPSIPAITLGFCALLISTLFGLVQNHHFMIQIKGENQHILHLLLLVLFTVSSLFWGIISDKIKAKKTLSITLPMTIFGLILLSVESIPHYFFLGLFFVLCGTASLHICYMHLLYHYFPDKKILPKISKHLVIATLLFVVSSTDFSQGPIAFPLLLIALALLVFYFLLNFSITENSIKGKKISYKNSFSTISTILKNPISFSYLCNASFPLAGIVCFILLSPYILLENRYISEEYMMIILLLTFFFILSSYLTSKYYNKFSPDVLIRVSNLLIVLASFIFINIIARPFFSPFAFVFPMLIWAYSMGTALSCSLYSVTQHFKDHLGVLMGVLTFMQILLSTLHFFLARSIHHDYRFTLAATLILIAMQGSWIYYVLIVHRLKP